MRILLGLLMMAGSASAQSVFSKDSSVVKEMELPAKQPFDTARKYNTTDANLIYLVSDHDVYNFFGYDIYMKFYQFNFADFHILGELKCRQCMTSCRHEEGNPACHRNQCMKEWEWVMRDNKKALREIAVSVIPGHDRKDLPLYNDTVIASTADSSKWYTTGHGDCFASFKYGLFADNYHPVLLLKEWNFWGGCRAGGSKDFIVHFKEPPGILHKVKRTILMEKYKEWN